MNLRRRTRRARRGSGFRGGRFVSCDARALAGCATRGTLARAPRPARPGYRGRALDPRQITSTDTCSSTTGPPTDMPRTTQTSRPLARRRAAAGRGGGAHRSGAGACGVRFASCPGRKQAALQSRAPRGRDRLAMRRSVTYGKPAPELGAREGRPPRRASWWLEHRARQARPSETERDLVRDTSRSTRQCRADA